jgi:hypothetical protein
VQGRAQGVPADVFALAALMFNCIYRDHQLCPPRTPCFVIAIEGDRPLRCPAIRDRVLLPVELPQSPAIPDALGAVLRTGLSIRPQDRFQRTAQMRQALLATR